MAIFEPTRLTRKGRELMNKVYTGTPLSICGVVVGDGYLDEGETALDITELKNRLEAVECGIISNEAVSSTESMITVRVKSGAQIFTLREIGILAADPDGGDPILYAYTNAGDYPDFIPSTRTSSRINRDYGVIMAVGDAENLVIENISFAEVSREEFESHTHAELHRHDNKDVLDGITQGDVDDWKAAAGGGAVVADGSITAAKLAASVKAELDKAHTHGNKSVLDNISNDDPSNWSEAYDKRHTHSNKSVLDGITSTLVRLWNSAYDAMHSHSNKSTLDEISSTDTSNWKTAASNIASHLINKSNPHKVTKSQVGLSNVTNVAQASKAEFNTLEGRVNDLFDAMGDAVYFKCLRYADSYSVCNDFDKYKLDENAGSQPIMVVGSAPLPKSSTARVFFCSCISSNDDEIVNVQGLLYPDGTIYERYAVLWYYLGGADGKFTEWATSTSYEIYLRECFKNNC